MAYDKQKIFEQAKEVIVKHKLFFIDDIVAFLPIHKATFYEFFPPESEKSDELKRMLETNRVELKVSMRSKWYKSNSPALQMALMKIIATPEELKKLSMHHSDVTTNGKEIQQNISILNIDPLSTNEETNDSITEN
jgi:hypothetical protein